MRKLLSWFVSRPINATFIVLLVMGVGGHFLANWLADRRWQAYCETARARGAKLSLMEFVPAEIPDSENFAALPMFRGVFAPRAKNPMSLHLSTGDFPGFGKPLKGEGLNWKTWQRYFRMAGLLTQTTDNPPRDVLQALEHYAPEMAEWSQWRTRPRCRFPLDYKAGNAMPLPHLQVIKGAADIFTLRMLAHLALEDSNAAYADFLEGWQGYRMLSHEPSMAAGVTQTMILSALTSSVGGGLSDHHWFDLDLVKIEADLAKVQMGVDYRRAISTERSFNNSMYDQIADASPVGRVEFFAATSSPPRMLWPLILIPRRFYRDNQLRSNQYVDELIAGLSDDSSSFTLDSPKPSAPKNSSRGLDEYYFSLHRLVSSVYEDVTRRFIKCETRVRQARLACALERFRIARGVFPESLEELVPRFIEAVPLDICSGQPMIYRRVGAQSFLLYSVGLNRVDDHGIVDPNQRESQQLDDVWLFAPAGAP